MIQNLFYEAHDRAYTKFTDSYTWIKKRAITKGNRSFLANICLLLTQIFFEYVTLTFLT